MRKWWGARNESDPGVKERTRQKLREDFGVFCRRAWREVEPGKELQWNWLHELICEYLMQAYGGEELRLIFCMPPRGLKSKLISVFFPAWCWTKSPEQSFILTSYSDSLSEELNMARRTLLQSDWFQETFPNTVRFSPDQNRREQYKNLAGGQAIATSTEGTLIGKGADYLLVDDLLSPQQSYSYLECINANRFFDSTLRSRLNDPMTGKVIVVCQRLNERDLVAHLQENEPSVWTFINLTMEAEQDEEIRFPVSGRMMHRKAGDLLHPARWPKSWCEKQKRTLGRLVWSSQYQQRPSPLEGNLIKASDIQYYGGKDLLTGDLDAQLPASFERTILSVDCSFKDLSTSDYVAILVIGVVGSRRYVRHIVNARLDLDGTENEIRAAHRNYAPVSAVLVEDKANGSAVIKHLRDEIPGLIPLSPEGGKTSRIMAASPEFQAHNWFFDRTGAWTSRAIDQLCQFPNAKNDDLADAVSQAAIWMQANAYELGLVDFFKKLATGAKKVVSSVEGPLQRKPQPGAAEPASPVVTKDQWREWCDHHKAPPCPHPECKSTATVILNARLHCNNCGRYNGQELPKTPGQCCGNFLAQNVSGQIRCGNCGTQTSSGAVIAGVSRKDYVAGVGRHRAFGRFG